MLCAYIHEPSFHYDSPAWGLRLCYHGIRFVAPGAQEGALLRLTNTLRSGETVGDLDILDGAPTCLSVFDQLFYPGALLPTSYLPYHTTAANLASSRYSLQCQQHAAGLMHPLLSQAVAAFCAWRQVKAEGPAQAHKQLLVIRMKWP